MPLDFKRSYSESYQKVLDETVILDRKLAARNKNEFVALTAFEVERILHSGKVVYGDSISSYCNQILDVLLADEVDLRKKFRIYTMRSPDANAFSTHQGILFVTTGLIARLEGEAQLAYVLAHEVAHFIKKHQLDWFNYNEKLIFSDKTNLRLTLSEKHSESMKYSKQAEYEADELGLELFMAAGYDPNQAIATMEMLRRSTLPVLDHFIDYTSLQDENFTFRPVLIEFDSVNSEPDLEIDETNSTHPNASNRIKRIREKLAGQPKSGKLSLISGSQFQQNVDMARRDVLYSYMVDGDFVRALELNEALIESGPVDSTDLQISRAMCYYGLQVLANQKWVLNRPFYETGKTAGTGQNINDQFFTKLHMGEMNLIAIREIWKTYQHFPEIQELELVLSKSLLSSLSKKVFVKNSDSLIVCNNKIESRYVDAFESLQYRGIKNPLDAAWKSYQNISDTPVPIQGITRLLLFKPIFVNRDLGQPSPTRLQNQENYQNYVFQLIQSYSKKLGIVLVNPDVNKPDKGKTVDFNYKASLLDYLQITESMDQNFYSIVEPDIEEIRQHYNVDHIGISVVGYFRKKHNRKSKTVYIFALLDIKNGDVDYGEFIFFKARKRKYLLKAHIYNSLNQIRK